MTIVNPTINGHAMHSHEAVRLAQRYQLIPPPRWRRTLGGRLVARPHFRSIATALSGRAWQPPAMLDLDTGAVVELGCAQPLGLNIDADVRITALAFRARDDAGVWAVAVVDGRPVATEVTRTGRAVVVAAVANATAYRVHWFPVMRVLASLDTVAHTRNTASHDWTLDAELVDGGTGTRAAAAAAAAAAARVRAGATPEAGAEAIRAVLEVLDAAPDTGANVAIAVAAAGVDAIVRADTAGTAADSAAQAVLDAAVVATGDVPAAAATAAATATGGNAVDILAATTAATASAQGAFSGVVVDVPAGPALPAPVIVFGSEVVPAATVELDDMLKIVGGRFPTTLTPATVAMPLAAASVANTAEVEWRLLVRYLFVPTGEEARPATMGEVSTDAPNVHVLTNGYEPGTETIGAVTIASGLAVTETGVARPALAGAEVRETLQRYLLLIDPLPEGEEVVSLTPTVTFIDGASSNTIGYITFMQWQPVARA